MTEGGQKKEVKKVNMVDILPIPEYRIFKTAEITIRRGLK
jgi:hypothetical protein